MTMLNTTIFDCLIFKGYGNRVAARSHVPGELCLVYPPRVTTPCNHLV